MLIVVGLDACEISFIEKFCLAGELPFISKVIDNNQFLNLESPSENVASGSTWVSLLTGLNPAKHGYYFDHRQLRNGTYNIDRFYAGESNVKYFWEYLSHKKIVTFDIPYSNSKNLLNGLGITAWGLESRNFETSSHPPDLIVKILSKFGSHPLLHWYHQKLKNEDMMDEFFNRVFEGLEKRFSIIEELIKQDKWDLFFCSINEFHWTGHFVFDFISSDYYENTQYLREKYIQKLKEIYIKTDQFLSKLSDSFPEAGLVFFSNTGMRENLSGRHIILPLLQKMGYYPETKNSWSPAERFGSFGTAKIENAIGANNIAFVKKFFPEKMWNKFSRKVLNKGVKWAESIAFEIPGDYSGLIRINLKGREPQGKVDPSEYDDVCEKISKALIELKHLKSGKPVVKEVIKMRDKYKGNLIDWLPDLSVIWESQEHITDVVSPTFGRMTGSLPDKRSGAHRSDAFIGFHNLKGTIHPGNLNTESIAPTILTLLGVTIPETMDEESLFQLKN